ncbi:ATP-binding protein [Raineyella sp.]|nr:SbcC/MukB-like Walker B domain-containing protein [Raineyella sp.]MEA5155420.1 SbcC/MukB-like Walker B domain-containing protein [Raineyella sp.]
MSEDPVTDQTLLDGTRLDGTVPDEMLLSDGEDQWRISVVQVVNWGGYGGHHVMHVRPDGTAILGPTGMGKSTILDAMSAVMMPNPPSFNRAARDDGGKRSERTVYSYARGKIDDVLAADGRTTRTHYLRPPGERPFPSAAAITWTNRFDEHITSARVVWVGADAAANSDLNSTTRYLLVRGLFDLSRLNEAIDQPLRGTRTWPLDTNALKRLLNPNRDLVTASQPEFEKEMCRLLGIGRSDESSRRALELLRNAQASKGIFSINALFKDFVLDRPLALERWETALVTYREAAQLYDVFEDARTRYEVLKDVPELAERYRTALADSATEWRLLGPAAGSGPAASVTSSGPAGSAAAEAAEDDRPSPLELWNAEHLLDWAAARIDKNRTRATELGAIAKGHDAEAIAARDEEEALTQRYYAKGGGDSEDLVRRRQQAATQLAERTAARQAYVDRAQWQGFAEPADEPAFAALVQSIHERLRGLPDQDAEWKSASYEAASARGRTRDELRSVKEEIASLKRRRSNVPAEADRTRREIADACGLDPARLPYVGELLEVKPEERRWATAVDRVIGQLAQNIIVAPEDWRTVTGYVNDHRMRGRVVLVPARPAHNAAPVVLPDSVPDKLRMEESGPYAEWLLDHLVAGYSVLCVADAAGLDAPRRAGYTGAVTLAGMRTAAQGRVIKDDRRLPSWLGLDNAATVAALEERAEALRATIGRYDAELEDLDRRRRDGIDVAGELRWLSEQTWASIDVASARAAEAHAAELLGKFTQGHRTLDSLKAERAAARDRYVSHTTAAARAREQRAGLDEEWGALVDLQDEMSDVASRGTLTEQDRTTLGRLGFPEPADAAGARDTLGIAAERLRALAHEHTGAVELAETALVGIFREYLRVDPRAEIDETIASLSAVEAILADLESDDLPRARAEWLAKTREDMQRSLRTLLVQIEEDRRSIRDGLLPVNRALSGVEFRDGSRLQIEDRPIATADLDDFRATITRYTAVGTDGIDEELTERMFVAMRRDLARLDEQSTTAEAWRRRVFDAREHVEFRAVEHRPGGEPIVHDGVSGKSGGEGQELIAFILGAALRYQLGDGTDQAPRFAPIVLDEGFVKADSEYTGRALHALQSLGFQLVIGAPRDKAAAFEDYVGSIVYVNRNPDRDGEVRLYEFAID